jgi:RNA polymerase sigma factor for flagellar operon FliA
LRRTATISRGAIRYRRQFDAARDALTDRLGRQPCEAEMAQHVEMSVSAYRAVEATTHGIEFAAIDEAYTDHNEWFADRSTPSAYSILEADRAQQAVALAIAKLPHREQLVLQLFFVEELSLADIGKVLDVGGARVCQIKKAALARLRAQLGGWATQ